MDHKKNIKLIAQITSLYSLAIIIAYILIGFLVNTPWAYGTSNSGWAIGWILLLTTPIVTSIITVFYTRNLHQLAVWDIALCLFLFLGMTMKLWHPMWILFLCVPAYHIIVNPFCNKVEEVDEIRKKVVKDEIVDVKDVK